jgi:hypothetical protein
LINWVQALTFASDFELTYGVMVTHQFLVLVF